MADNRSLNYSRGLYNCSTHQSLGANNSESEASNFVVPPNTFLHAALVPCLRSKIGSFAHSHFANRNRYNIRRGCNNYLTFLGSGKVVDV